MLPVLLVLLLLVKMPTGEMFLEVGEKLYLSHGLLAVATAPIVKRSNILGAQTNNIKLN